MSLEVTLIPIALVVASVIDQNYYQSWQKAKRIKKKSQYSSVEEIVEDLNRSSLKYEQKYDVIKICSQGGNNQYYFSKIDGIWTFSYNEFDNKNDVELVLKEIERVSGGKIDHFIEKTSENKRVIKAANVKSMPPISFGRPNTYPTIFQDMDLLKKSLEKSTIKYSLLGDDIEFTIEGVKCVFKREASGKYELVILNGASEKEIFKFLQELDVVYKRDVQARTYDYIIQRLSHENMSLVNEERTEDETIVLTLNVED